MVRSSIQNPDSGSSHEPAALQLTFDRTLLRELVEEVLRETLSALDWPTGRIALDEAEAAQACGVRRHVFRDLRLSGAIKAQKIGRKFIYTRADLLAVLRSIQDTSGEEGQND